MPEKRASLSEIMGKAGADKASQGSVSLKDLPEILGENMPEMDLSTVGRIRLIRALRQRFGDNFRSLPGIKGIIKDFDDKASLAVKAEKIKRIRMPKEKK